MHAYIAGAVQSAAALMTFNVNELLQRLGVVIVEDAMLCSAFPVLQWLMAASYKGVVLSHEQVCCSVLLQCVAVCCSMLQCDAVCFGVSKCVVVCSRCYSGLWLLVTRGLSCLTSRCVAVCCSVLQFVAVCCSVLQCDAVCFCVLQCVPDAAVACGYNGVALFHDPVCCSVLQCVAVCCSLLQFVAVCCSVLQYAAV